MLFKKTASLTLAFFMLVSLFTLTGESKALTEDNNLIDVCMIEKSTPASLSHSETNVQISSGEEPCFTDNIRKSKALHFSGGNILLASFSECAFPLYEISVRIIKASPEQSILRRAPTLV